MPTDLHMHTTASDGELTPEALIHLARKRGLTTLAITDHDNTDGVRDAIQIVAAQQIPITVIPGIELGAADDEQLIDVLGYFIPEAQLDDAAEFQAWLRDLRGDRYTRGQRMVEQLAAVGASIRFERVLEIADAAPVTRPHVARALVEAGYAESVKDAFNRWIGEGQPGYVARKRLSPEDAIARLHSIGACAVLAHPGRVRQYNALIERLAAAGLDGVELNHPDNSDTVRLDVRGQAKMHDLILTGGSDFHYPLGDGTITLGRYNPPDGAVEALRERARRYQ
jgi:3',5'-nucleoside bisphosphate phosphatase